CCSYTTSTTFIV
nr:immunoglobulin light chain junction region [Macaca mulatta]